jgi:hypothetical protein
MILDEGSDRARKIFKIFDAVVFENTCRVKEVNVQRNEDDAFLNDVAEELRRFRLQDQDTSKNKNLNLDDESESAGELFDFSKVPSEDESSGCTGERLLKSVARTSAAGASGSYFMPRTGLWIY